MWVSEFVPSPYPATASVFLSKIVAKEVTSGSYRAFHMTWRNAYLASWLSMHGVQCPLLDRLKEMRAVAMVPLRGLARQSWRSEEPFLRSMATASSERCTFTNDQLAPGWGEHGYPTDFYLVSSFCLWPKKEIITLGCKELTSFPTHWRTAEICLRGEESGRTGLWGLMQVGIGYPLHFPNRVYERCCLMVTCHFSPQLSLSPLTLPPPSMSTSPHHQFNLPSIEIISGKAANLCSSLTTGLRTEEAWRLTGCHGEE